MKSRGASSSLCFRQCNDGVSPADTGILFRSKRGSRKRLAKDSPTLAKNKIAKGWATRPAMSGGEADGELSKEVEKLGFVRDPGALTATRISHIFHASSPELCPSQNFRFIQPNCHSALRLAVKSILTRAFREHRWPQPQP